MQQSLSRTQPAYILQRHGNAACERFAGEPGDVRRADHVGQGKQWRIRRQGLTGKNVQPRGRNVAALQGLDQRRFVDETAALEGKDGILSVSLIHGFAWADFPEMGASVVVVADGNAEKAKALAETLGRRFFGMRDRIKSPLESLDQALDQAMAEQIGRAHV